MQFERDPNKHLLFRVNNKNTRERCEICSKSAIKTSEQCLSGVFTVNFEYLSHLVLVLLLLTLNMYLLAGTEIKSIGLKDKCTKTKSSMMYL